MKPFNLERALAGDPVVTVIGYRVTDLWLAPIDSEFPLWGRIHGEPLWSIIRGEKITFEFSWTRDGTCLTEPGNGLDLRMT